MNNSNLIVHVGMHKTGTTFLQNHFFPNLIDVQYLKENRSLFSVSEKIPHSKSRLILFSSENLSGNPWTKKNSVSEPTANNWLREYEKNIIEIKDKHPEANVLIVFRKHGDFLLSLYKQYIHEGGTLSLLEFYGESKFITSIDLLYKTRIDFLKSHNLNFYVLDFEEFKNIGTQYFIDFFKSEFGVEVSIDQNSTMSSNKGISGRGLEMCRKMNRYFLILPIFLRKVLRKLKLHPRYLIQKRFKFLNTPDSNEHLEIVSNINALFHDDWLYVQKNKFVKHLN